MRLLADQNIPRAVVNTLRDEGYDVEWAQETHPGADDDVLLTLAVDEGRIVLTFDKDFGELAFRTRLPASCGIILLRITLVSPSAVALIPAVTPLRRFTPTHVGKGIGLYLAVLIVCGSPPRMWGKGRSGW